MTRGFARDDGLIALALGACALVLYAASLPPSFAFWDTGELQTVSAILGIAHPPGCPAFVLLGWLFIHALPWGEPAWRVNAMCAFAMALAAALLYATMRVFGVPRLIAATCTCGFAAAGVPWRDATRAEVQDVALAFRAGAFFFAARWYVAGRGRDLFPTALWSGLALATHGIALLLLPSLAMLLWARPAALGPRALLLLAGGFVLGLSPYLYIPLRSAYIARAHLDPTLALGLPVGLPFWNYDDPQSVHSFFRFITGADFDVHSGFAGFIAVRDFPRYAAALVTNVAGAYGLPGAIFAALGAGIFVARQRIAGIALVLAAVLPVPYTEAYNELQDPSRYYVFSLWCGALAIATAFEYIADLLGLASRSLGRFGLALALSGSFIAAGPQRLSYFAQRTDPGAAPYVDDVMATTPGDAIVVAEWAYASPLAYAAYVRHRFGKRTVVAASPAQFATLYRAWLRTRPVYIVAFDDSLTVAGYRIEPVVNSYFHEYRVVATATASAKR